MSALCGWRGAAHGHASQAWRMCCTPGRALAQAILSGHLRLPWPELTRPVARQRSGSPAAGPHLKEKALSGSSKDAVLRVGPQLPLLAAPPRCCLTQPLTCQPLQVMPGVCINARRSADACIQNTGFACWQLPAPRSDLPSAYCLQPRRVCRQEQSPLCLCCWPQFGCGPAGQPLRYLQQ